MIEKRKRQLEDGLLLFEPRRLAARVRTVRDIFGYRHVLKQAPFSAHLIEHMTRLIHDALNSRTRFRVFDSLKVLRAVVLSGGGRQLPARIVKRLVTIYEKLILSSREEVQWCLSRLLKDQVLGDDAVGWLVEHWTDSVHIVNRLLRYPKVHPRIIEWAGARYRAGNLADRRSELIAILLSAAPADKFRSEDPEVLGWAIMQSALSRSVKIAWLSSLAADLPTHAVITFAGRLDAPVILRRALRSNTRTSRYRGETPNQRMEATRAGLGTRAAHS
jgi:hypothetical protein